MRFLIYLLPAILVLGGCATNFTKGVNTVNSVEFKVSRSDRNAYILHDGKQRLAFALPKDGKLTFMLPPNGEISTCLSVIDQTGRSVLPDKQFLLPAVRYEYQQNLNRRATATAELDEAIKNDPKNLLNAAQARLRQNRAFLNSSCSRPEQRPIPPQPIVRCSSQRECQVEGAAICYSIYFASKGCEKAFNELRIPGILSSPSCAAMAAKLAEEKYDLNDAVKDLLLAAIANGLTSSDSFGDNLLGWGLQFGLEVAALNKARSCTTTFVRTHWGPLGDWETLVDQIRAEPDQQLLSCQQDLRNIPLWTQQIAVSPSKIPELEARLAAINDKLKSLESDRRPIEWCRN